MQAEKRLEKFNPFGIDDPYERSLKALYEDLEEQIKVTRQQLEHLEKLRRDLEKQQKRLAA